MLLMTLMLLAAAGPSPQSLDAPRKAYSACIRDVEKKSLAAKAAAEAHSAALRSACQAEAARLTSALVAYDVAMGAKRATASASAATDVADYVTTSEERYKDLTAPQ